VQKLKERPATYEDLLKVPEHLVAEIVEGELYTWPRPRRRHERAAGQLLQQIGPAFDGGRRGPGDWWIAHEPELHLGPDIVVPDLAGWRRERVVAHDDFAAYDIAPDWICEVISPSTGRHDRVRKLPLYAREGVPYAWLVDPALQTLEVFRRQGSGWILAASFGGDDLVRAEPFEELELNLADLWLADPPQPDTA
jgi:Uma2 family endonuclease